MESVLISELTINGDDKYILNVVISCDQDDQNINQRQGLLLDIILKFSVNIVNVRGIKRYADGFHKSSQLKNNYSNSH